MRQVSIAEQNSAVSDFGKEMSSYHLLLVSALVVMAGPVPAIHASNASKTGRHGARSAAKFCRHKVLGLAALANFRAPNPRGRPEQGETSPAMPPSARPEVPP